MVSRFWKENESIFNAKAFGLKLKTIRNSLGLTKQKFSKVIGVCPSKINDIESGNTPPSLLNVCRIADGLGISIDSLLENHIPNQSPREYHENDAVIEELAKRLRKFKPEAIQELIRFCDALNQ